VQAIHTLVYISAPFSTNSFDFRNQHDGRINDVPKKGEAGVA